MAASISLPLLKRKCSLFYEDEEGMQINYKIKEVNKHNITQLFFINRGNSSNEVETFKFI